MIFVRRLLLRRGVGWVGVVWSDGWVIIIGTSKAFGWLVFRREPTTNLRSVLVRVCALLYAVQRTGTSDQCPFVNDSSEALFMGRFGLMVRLRRTFPERRHIIVARAFWIYIGGGRLFCPSRALPNPGGS
jgi:hypothetical protein